MHSPRKTNSTSATMRLPHLQPFAKTPLYFLTACMAQRRSLLACTEAHDSLREIWSKSAEHDGWFVGRYVLMPDHVHLFAVPSSDAKRRDEWLKSWKSVSSRRLAKFLSVEPPIWQADTFDHLLRSAESYSEKWDYVRANPVRRGLVAKADEWPWQGEIHSLQY
ncbi:MAG: transposase [Verrucomicrobia bacterium]|nr:transposase [Verrucomicrobiota bacterium]